MATTPLTFTNDIAKLEIIYPKAVIARELKDTRKGLVIRFVVWLPGVIMLNNSFAFLNEGRSNSLIETGSATKTTFNSDGSC